MRARDRLHPINKLPPFLFHEEHKEETKVTIKSTCGKYEVNVMENGRNAEHGYIVAASICDGQSYGGSSYWFHIGHYKTLKNALTWAKKKMADHNIELQAA